MKKLLSFDEFINESLINEGAGAAKMAKLLAVDFSAEAYIEEKSDMPELVKDTKIICKMLGDSPQRSSPKMLGESLNILGDSPRF